MQEALNSDMEANILLKHDGYKKLLSYQKSLIVYQITVIFCNRFLNCRDRTVDQMIQAARSGKQNIIKGCMTSGISRETEIMRVGLSRSSLEELSEDYQDYLRTHRAQLWAKDSMEAVHMRKIGRGLPNSKSSILELVRTRKAPVICNMAICLIHQTNCLLDQQLHHLEGRFLSRKSLRGKMYHARRLVR